MSDAGSPREDLFGTSRGTDPLLGMFSVLVEHTGWELWLTLSVGGQQLTGRLIGPSVFLQLLDQALERHDTEMGHAAGFVRHHLSPTAQEPPAGDAGDAMLPELAPEWIHLADAVSDDGRRSPLRFWRGRGSDISGWSMTRGPGRSRGVRPDD